MEKIHRTKLLAMIEGLNGKLFSVKFVKRDGSIRQMLCRTGVQRNLKGGENKVAKRKDLPYIVVFDFGKMDYRMINPATALEVKSGGKVWEVIG